MAACTSARPQAVLFKNHVAARFNHTLGLQVLDIDPQWRMHQVSDGQRRRVQICVGLLRPFKVGPTLTPPPFSVW